MTLIHWQTTWPLSTGRLQDPYPLAAHMTLIHWQHTGPLSTGSLQDPYPLAVYRIIIHHCQFTGSLSKTGSPDLIAVCMTFMIHWQSFGPLFSNDSLHGPYDPLAVFWALIHDWQSTWLLWSTDSLLGPYSSLVVCITIIHHWYSYSSLVVCITIIHHWYSYSSLVVYMVLIHYWQYTVHLPISSPRDPYAVAVSRTLFYWQYTDPFTMAFYNVVQCLVYRTTMFPLLLIFLIGCYTSM